MDGSYRFCTRWCVQELENKNEELRIEKLSICKLRDDLVKKRIDASPTAQGINRKDKLIGSLPHIY